MHKMIKCENIAIMKYKPCCNTVCMVHGCESREQGACYCCCRLLDHIDNMHQIINGKAFFKGECIVYPGFDKHRFTPHANDIEVAKEQLVKLQEKLKDYLINA